jgi:pyrroline-5-carboxylate reductase
MTAKIGFIGAGRMAEAMMRGLIAEDVYSEDEMIACAPSSLTRERITDELNIKMYKTAAEIAKLVNIVVIAVKPKQVQELFEVEKLVLGPEHLVISIVAGVKISTLESNVPDARIIRVMPNHCCLVLEGASGFSGGSKATEDDMDHVECMLSSMGMAIEVKEEELDGVTGVSGSSPAFLYILAEAMAEIGKKNGLPYDVGIDLAAQSMVGAGRMILETGMTPQELIDNVCTPGDATIEGIKALEENGYRKAIQDAVEAVVKRSKAMGV